MRSAAAIQADLDAEIARHRAAKKRLLRELSEARGVRYAPARMEAIKADYLAGKSRATIRATHKLTRGQLAGLLERHKWRRPSPLSSDALYRKLRRLLGMSHAEALAEVKRLSAASPVIPTAASPVLVDGRWPVAPCLPTVAPALNSEAADG